MSRPITKEQIQQSGQANIVFIETLTSDPTFFDKDEVLLHVSFQLLVNFVEEEWMTNENFSPDNFPDFEREQRAWFEQLRTPISPENPAFFPDDPEINDETNLANKEQAEAEEALLDLYKWWKYDRKEERAALHRNSMQEMMPLITEFDDREQEMFEKLARYRRAMWI